MQHTRSIFLALLSFSALSACGGGGGGGGIEDFATRYAALAGDPTLVSPTMQSTVDNLPGSATYAGIVNVSTERAANPAGSTFYYGDLSIGVNFDSGTLNGNAGNFVQYFSEIASDKTGSGVSGSLAITGVLGANNESLGDGLSGTATGSIDNVPVTYTVEGNITGVSGNAMSLDFDGPGLSGGIGLAVR